MNSSVHNQEEHIKYSRVFSSLFCSVSIVALSLLCLLNTLSIDIYSACVLLKVVVPAALIFWIIGKVIGRIFDGLNKEIVQSKIIEEQKAYEIPSMFSPEVEQEENDETETL